MTIMTLCLRRKLSIWVTGKKSNKYRRKNPALFYNSKSIVSANTNINYKIIFNSIKILILTIALIYLTFYSKIFSIKEIIVSGNNNIKTEDITRYSYLGNNILFEKTDDIENNILSNIPEINNVRIYKGIPSALKIIVEENKPTMLWVTNDKKYLINDLGKAYKEINDISVYSNLPIIYDNKNISLSIPSKITTQKYIYFVTYIKDNIKNEVNIEPDTFFVEETTVDLNLRTKNGYYIKFDTLRSPQQQIKNLKLVLMQKKEAVTEYIDVRVNGWAYYK